MQLRLLGLWSCARCPRQARREAEAGAREDEEDEGEDEEGEAAEEDALQDETREVRDSSRSRRERNTLERRCARRRTRHSLDPRDFEKGRRCDSFPWVVLEKLE